MGASETAIRKLSTWLQAHAHVAVITGAGVSTASGIPDYRDDHGDWKRRAPIQHRDFVQHASTRQRYWARSFVGWRHFSAAEPNAAHHALAALERMGCVRVLITQNVDRLHEKAGSRHVIDLHGRLDRVGCLSCHQVIARDAYQAQLAARNPGWTAHILRIAPDGDADLQDADYARFQVAACARCGGVMKPEVVFYGGMLDPATRSAARDAVARADALLVAGSSLMVASAYTLVRAAAEHGIPVAAVNRGHTRADELLALKLSADCGAVLAAVATAIASEREALMARPARP